MKQYKPLFLSAIVAIALASLAVPSLAGDLNPSAPPGPTMKTLDQIPPTWDQVLPASERFKLVMGGAAVLDKETGLVWEKTPSYIHGDDPDWFQAIYRCTWSNIGGRRGWRLPSIHELLSLVDTTQSSFALPSGHPFNFTNIYRYIFWSSTAFPFDPSLNAWVVNFNNGEPWSALKDGDKLSPRAWCVRGGSGADAQ